MKILHLNLKRKWFDMILSGEKKEEQREIKPYWITRLVDQFLFKMDTVEEFLSWCNKNNLQLVVNKFETITFSNGYSKDRDQFTIECLGIDIKEGNPNWGAETGKKYFVMKLGNKL